MTSQQVIRSYLVIAGLSTLSASLIWGVNTLFLLDAGLDIFGVFVANAVFTGSMALFEIPTGVLADTRGRRTSFLLSVAVVLVGTLGYVGTAAVGGSLLLFCIMSVILGLGFTFYSGAVEAWLVDALNATGYAGQLDQVFARGSIVSGAAMLVGTVSGGLLGSLDLIREEEKMMFLGPGPAQVYDFAGLELELERFSLDRDWMPRLVLMAKHTYVWLAQLSRKYQRPITRLDEIPDEELDTLAQRGFSGLWLIGLWERSTASQRIKQLCGNPEAAASAYSLFDYQIAADLGGQEAYQNLKDRAWQRGVRLASDMVPNHMGVYSDWVIQHPDWFISLDYSPFPSYSFGGQDFR